MPVIECAWLLDGEEELCILRPEEPCAHSQYAVMLYREKRTHAIYVTGHEQFKALELCLTEAGLHMSGGFSRMMEGARAPGSRRRGAGASKAGLNQLFEEGPVSVAVVTHKDKSRNEKYDVGVLVRSESTAAGRKPSTSVLTNMSEAELESIGNLFWSISYAEFKPAFVSNIEEWFLPPALSRVGQPEHLMRAELLRQAVAHIGAQCPEFVDAWIEYLGRIEIPVTLQCITCLGSFPGARNVKKQRRQCVGCASGKGSSAYTEQQLVEVKTLAPWLQSLRTNR